MMLMIVKKSLFKFWNNFGASKSNPIHDEGGLYRREPDPDSFPHHPLSLAQLIGAVCMEYGYLLPYSNAIPALFAQTNSRCGIDLIPLFLPSRAEDTRSIPDMLCIHRCNIPIFLR